MSRLAEVFRRFWPGYRERHGEAVPLAHVRAAEAIIRCRTPECGTVFHRCAACGRWEATPVSCGHRACDGCGGHRAMEWEARQKARLLPVPYHMVTFTVPGEFREMFRANQRLCYDVFFKECAGALMDLARDPKLLGGEIGMTGVLQPRPLARGRDGPGEAWPVGLRRREAATQSNVDKGFEIPSPHSLSGAGGGVDEGRDRAAEKPRRAGAGEAAGGAGAQPDARGAEKGGFQALWHGERQGVAPAVECGRAAGGPGRHGLWLSGEIHPEDGAGWRTDRGGDRRDGELRLERSRER